MTQIPSYLNKRHQTFLCYPLFGWTRCRAPSYEDPRVKKHMDMQISLRGNFKDRAARVATLLQFFFAHAVGPVPRTVSRAHKLASRTMLQEINYDHHRYDVVLVFSEGRCMFIKDVGSLGRLKRALRKHLVVDESVKYISHYFTSDLMIVQLRVATNVA